MGNILYLAAVILSGTLGFKGYHFIWNVAFGMVAFQVAYMVEHISLMLQWLHNFRYNPWKSVMVIFIQMFTFHLAYSALVYGFGFETARLLT